MQALQKPNCAAQMARKGRLKATIGDLPNSSGIPEMKMKPKYILSAVIILMLMHCTSLIHKIRSGDHINMKAKVKITQEQLDKLILQETTEGDVEDIFGSNSERQYTYSGKKLIHTDEGKSYSIDRMIMYEDGTTTKVQTAPGVTAYNYKGVTLSLFFSDSVLQFFYVRDFGPNGSQVPGPLHNQSTEYFAGPWENHICDFYIYYYYTLENKKPHYKEKCGFAD